MKKSKKIYTHDQRSNDAQKKKDIRRKVKHHKIKEENVILTLMPKLCDLFACVTFLLPPGIKALKLNHLKIEYSQSVIKLKLRICMPLEIKNLDNIHLDNEGRMK